MAELLGIDLGTSAVKAALIDEAGRLLAVGSCEYPIETPQPGYAEQQPERWWQATTQAVRQAVAQVPHAEIVGIGLCGQMHGPVLLGTDHQPLGPAIIWADQRGAAQVGELIEQVGRERFAAVGTLPAAGFMAPTLRWLQQHDPARLAKVFKCVLPKDYVRLRLTGEVATDASDASATALFDVRQRRWSQEMIAAAGLPNHIWPTVLESAQVAGSLSHEAASVLGLPPGIPVATGAADQAAAALASGLVDPGIGLIAISTGGTVVIPLAEPQCDTLLRIHTFCHAPADRWYLLGAMLSAGLSLRWLRDLQGWTSDPQAYSRLTGLADKVAPGSDGLRFLPYLVGERAPLMDPQARGAFVGLTLSHTLGHVTRAIMEGVAFGLRQIVEVMTELDIPAHTFYAIGGGLMNGPVWRQIVADVLNRPLRLAAAQERSAVGAAILSGIACGIYRNYAEAVQATALPYQMVEPQTGQTALYTECYQQFTELYPLLAATFHRMSAGR